MPTSARSGYLHCSRTTSPTSRTAVYGPVRTVVWQGSAGDCRPYADQTHQCFPPFTWATVSNLLHSLATFFAANEVYLSVIQSMLRHAKPSTRASYMHRVNAAHMLAQGKYLVTQSRSLRLQFRVVRSNLGLEECALAIEDPLSC
jgi:hypothetical protein